MTALELKIPPPVVALLLAIGMGLLPAGFGVLPLPPGSRIAAGIGLACLGQVISISGMWAFRQAQTTINPLKPGAASALVQGGVYRYTRNPMYVGLLLSLAGWAVFLGHALAGIGLPLFVAYLNRFQIRPEERVLAAKFGAAYTDYTQRVRRWAW